MSKYVSEKHLVEVIPSKKKEVISFYTHTYMDIDPHKEICRFWQMADGMCNRHKSSRGQWTLLPQITVAMMLCNFIIGCNLLMLPLSFGKP